MNEQAASSAPTRHTFRVDDRGVAQYDHALLELARVVRVVKGGRRFRFRASVIVGDRRGAVGFGVGKSKDVQQAIQKAQKQAARHVISVPVVKGTIGHTVQAKFNGAHVMLKPARVGTGMIAGGTVRLVADLCGISDLIAKSHGSSSKLNNAKAAIAALASLHKMKLTKPKEKV